MKRFIVSVLCVSVFFIGLGSLIEKAKATFKSDEKALELIRKARQAVGGDSAIAGVKSMTILGKATKTLEIEGAVRNEQGDLEINLELPNKMSRQMKIGSGNGDGNQFFDKKVDVILMKKGDGDNVQYRTEGGEPEGGVKTVIITKKDGTTGELKTEELKTDGKESIILKKSDGGNATFTSEDGKTLNVDGKTVFIKKADALGGEMFRTNELFRTTLALLLTAPEGLDVTYSYVGEGSVDGVSCDIISASEGGDSSIKLYLDKSTSLPRMMTFRNHKPFIIKFDKNEAKPEVSGEVKVFTRKLDAPEMAEFQVKFSDFRSVNGLQLPFKWTQTVNGKDDEVTEISSYEINPANIADKFKEEPTKVFLRTKKEQ